MMAVPDASGTSMQSERIDGAFIGNASQIARFQGFWFSNRNSLTRARDSPHVARRAAVAVGTGAGLKCNASLRREMRRILKLKQLGSQLREALQSSHSHSKGSVAPAASGAKP